MRMLIADIDNGTYVVSPTANFTCDTGTFSFFYGITSRTNLVNINGGTCGESMVGSIYMGTANNITLTWGTSDNIDNYCIYKGTADANGTYLTLFEVISGSLGTYTSSSTTLGTWGNIYAGSYQMAYTKAVSIPLPSDYTANFTNNLIMHDLSNFDMAIYDKRNRYKSSLSWVNLDGTMYTDLLNIYNWRSNLRFFPNFDSKTSIYFDTAWTSDWNFQLTTKHFINGGWNGQANLTGIKAINTLTEVI